MLDNGLFPFYEGDVLTFIPMDQVVFYGVAFCYNEQKFMDWRH